MVEGHWWGNAEVLGQQHCPCVNVSIASSTLTGSGLKSDLGGVCKH
jgi:hypothetical protein